MSSFASFPFEPLVDVHLGDDQQDAALHHVFISSPLSDRCRVRDVLRDKKDAVVQSYLEMIELRVDEFLQSAGLGYCKDALPPDYLDTPPRDMDAVVHNHEVLLHMISELFNPQSKVSAFTSELVSVVWSGSLLPLREDLCHAAATVTTPERRQSIAKDIEYIDQIRILESSWVAAAKEESSVTSGASASVSSVVPISALVASKLHRLENEHRTALEHWEHRLGK